MDEWSGKKVGILGAGVENLALTAYLLRRGAQVTLYDLNSEAIVKEKVKNLPQDNLVLKCGGNYLDEIDEAEVFFRSPGMILKKAQEILPQGAKLSSAAQLFFEVSPAKIIGVTGTKGKGTTASLIGAILDAAHDKGELAGKSYVVGNIGKSPFEIIDQLKSDDWVIMELSSFQLEDMTKSPQIAVVLEITPDHLDSQSKDHPNYHESLDQYVKAKSQIVRYQNSDDAAILVSAGPGKEFGQLTKGRVSFCGLENIDEGCTVENGWVVVKHDGKTEKILDTKNILLRGEHNLVNVTAAVAATDLAGVKSETIAEGVQNFRSLPHRLQFVRDFKGVWYWDDSYATGPKPTIAAIKAMAGADLVLIVGGSSKGADFAELAEAIGQKNMRAVIVIGEEGEKIIKAIKEKGIDVDIISGLRTMAEIVQKASEIAKSGDSVLLSPACASFDMFSSATDRGEQFQREVQSLK